MLFGYENMQSKINNDFYNDLGEGWYEDSNHPVALLRAENRIRIPWILSEIEAWHSNPCKVLDIGCGAGFLSNALAKKGHVVHGIDLSEESLEVAKEWDESGSVAYQYGDAMNLPFDDNSFEVVCAMDVLEHVQEPKKLIGEAARVLKKEGCFFFHTFNRNFLSYITVIKGVDWLVPNAPKHMHVYPLFIKPKELRQMCKEFSLQMEYILGFSPLLFSKEFRDLLLKRKISDRFPFSFTRNKLVGYSGMAIKYGSL